MAAFIKKSISAVWTVNALEVGAVGGLGGGAAAAAASASIVKQRFTSFLLTTMSLESVMTFPDPYEGFMTFLSYNTVSIQRSRSLLLAKFSKGEKISSRRKTQHGDVWPTTAFLLIPTKVKFCSVELDTNSWLITDLFRKGARAKCCSIEHSFSPFSTFRLASRPLIISSLMCLVVPK